jgi:predicted Zn-dependent protease
MYKITTRQKRNAASLGVTIKPSTNKSKKIDVFKNGQKIASIGAMGHMDYELYLKSLGKEYADERRKLYKIRHANNRNKIGTPGYYADRILW